MSVSGGQIGKNPGKAGKSDKNCFPIKDIAENLTKSEKIWAGKKS